jgi:hypothetical protein
MKGRVADDKKVAAELTLGMVTRVGSPHSVDDFGGHGLDTPDLVKKYADERLAKEKREMEEKQAREADAAPGAYKNRPKEETDPFAWAKGQDTQAQAAEKKSEDAARVDEAAMKQTKEMLEKATREAMLGSDAGAPLNGSVAPVIQNLPGPEKAAEKAAAAGPRAAAAVESAAAAAADGMEAVVSVAKASNSAAAAAGEPAVAKPPAAAVEGLIQEVTAYRVFMKNPQWYVKWTADNSESWETWDKLDSDHLREKARELEKAAKNDGL